MPSRLTAILRRNGSRLGCLDMGEIRQTWSFMVQVNFIMQNTSKHVLLIVFTITNQICEQVGGLEPWNLMTFHILGIIIPTDSYFFRGVAQPPTSNQWLIVILMVINDYILTYNNYESLLIINKPPTSWLVVSNMNVIFHFIYGMSSQPHWRTPSFFKMGTVDDQPASHDHPWIPGIKSPTANLGERSCKDGKEISHLKERIPTAYGQNQLWLLQNYDMYIYIYTLYTVYIELCIYIYMYYTHKWS